MPVEAPRPPASSLFFHTLIQYVEGVRKKPGGGRLPTTNADTDWCRVTPV
jgi:hypothetical protein